MLLCSFADLKKWPRKRKEIKGRAFSWPFLVVQVPLLAPDDAACLESAVASGQSAPGADRRRRLGGSGERLSGEGPGWSRPAAERP